MSKPTVFILATLISSVAIAETSTLDAVIDGAVRGAADAAIDETRDDDWRDDRRPAGRPFRHDDAPPGHRSDGFCPPGQAKKGRC